MELGDGPVVEPSEPKIIEAKGPALGLKVNMTYDRIADSWTFITERSMNALAFDRAKKKVFAYYKGVLDDLHPEDPFRDELTRSLLALEANRVRNVVKSDLDRSPF